MSGDRNFWQIWDFRSRDDDVDSSSDDSKSDCKDEPIRKLASALITEEDEVSDDPGYRKNNQVKPDKGVKSRKSRTKERLPRKTSGVKSKTKMSSRKEVSKRKRKSSALNPDSLDDLKNFTQSILEDLKVEREKMFARMKEDIQKLVSVKSTRKHTRNTKGGCTEKTRQARHKKSTESDIKVRNCSGGTLERSIVSSKKINSNNGSKDLEERVDYDQTVQTINSNKKNKEHVKMSAKQSTCSSSPCDPSSYLALPSAPSEKQFEHQSIESPSRNSTKPGVPGNGNVAGLAFDIGNSVINAMNSCGYFPGQQADIPFSGLAQMGSNSISFYDQHCSQTSSMGNGLPLHQRLDNSFNMQSRAENSPQGINMMGWRMNGGTIRFAGNGHTFTDNAANNFFNRMNYKTNGEVSGYGIQDLRDGFYKTRE